MTPLTRSDIRELQSQYPELPPDYLTHLEQSGWGPQPNGRMLYSGPVHPADIYGDSLDDSCILLIGDDGCGYCFGFDPKSKSYGELTDGGEWVPWGGRNLADYLS